MRRRTITLFPLPLIALVAWIVFVSAAYGSISDAPSPVIVVGFYLLPFLYIAYVFGYIIARLTRRVVPAAACALVCVALLALCGWRMPAFAHGVNGSNRPRESHIAVWTLFLVVPSIGGLMGSVPDLRLHDSAARVRRLDGHS